MRHRFDEWPRGVLSLLAAGWIWMFLVPMEKMGLLVNARGFLPVMAALAVIRGIPWRLLRAGAAFLLTGIATAVYFAPGRPWGARLVWLWHQERREIGALLQHHVLTDPLQTHLFLLGLCAMYALVAYAILRPSLWVFYNLLGIGVLGLIDANTPVHPVGVVVGVLAVFLAGLGVTHYARLRARASGGRLGPVRFFIPLAAVLSASLVAGWALPKRGPVWVNPFAPGTGAGGSGPGVHVIGYQTDNAHLGGSFVLDHTPVMSVVTEAPAYLRGEAYDLYTGQGWLADQKFMTTFSYGQRVAEGTVDESKLPGRDVRQTVTVLAPHLNAGVLFGAYAPDILWSMNGRTTGTVMVDPRQGTMFIHPLLQGDSYSVTSYELQAPGRKLAGIPLPKPDGDPTLPPSVRPDLELPASVPERVLLLARRVTQGSVDEYDAVQRIAQYLQANYTYATEGIPVPGPHQDYVDQFLFETKRGYCNNFSSAMAVMLRAIGVPARWVTGFTEGTIDTSYNGPGQRYTIENADAHSWVEVYFPGAGWVPFDPTPNFSMPFLPLSSDSSAGGVDANNSTPASSPQKPPQDAADPSSDAPAGAGAGGAIHPWWGRGALVLGLVGSVMAWVFRRRIRFWWHRRSWRDDSVAAMWAGLQRLVRILQKNGELPADAATLRDLMRVARLYGIAEPEYRQLVRTAERAVYGGEPVSLEERRRVREIWARWLEAALRWPGRR
ncbi:transglutaminase domain-containing protein [Alicyclobacillus sp.]|uniref:transglutaminase TgpA family protein n=1 Tax=Alicyclobacillus sp. TaxID=61169 RepID=UPI0025C38AD3|nr:transglutaminase domain-containing protein [Alicyclobacillus sp.]MCL6517987.1 DUF3488 and transglutaminase-like domain-containing protein [Alicyclobacillus sp.]